ncbi:MAG: hypothetical protein K5650_07905 [Bacteroidales bacterium]|nr:hypothetical protein [Bacteroidales bacterium]
MKRTIIAVAALLVMAGSAMAQNTFKGIVKYKVESTGEVAFQIPDEAAVAEIKVSGNDLYTKSAIFKDSPFTECTLVQNLTTTQCQDFSQLLDYLRSNGSEFTYQGSGKLIVKHTYKESDFDSVDIEDKEPGHFYYEYVNGETKEIAGFVAKKMIRHTYDAEGVDHPVEMWYSDEIGPKLNVLFGGIKGMPLQCTTDAGEGRAITYTATEIVKGKVKEADFLLPAGYEQLSDEDLETLGQELSDEIELLQGE